MSKVLNDLLSSFLIRRNTNDVMTKILPAKREYIVFCRLSPIQRKIYTTALSTSIVSKIMSGESTNNKQSNSTQKASRTNSVKILKLIHALRKVCSHPQLLLPNLKSVPLSVKATKEATKEKENDFKETCFKFNFIVSTL